MAHEMFLREHARLKDGREHGYWSLVETIRTADGSRQCTPCYLGELNGWAHARWQNTVEVFNEPTIEGREIWLRRIGRRDEEQQRILHQLQLQQPERLEPIRIQKCSADSAIA